MDPNTKKTEDKITCLRITCVVLLKYLEESAVQFDMKQQGKCHVFNQNVSLIFQTLGSSMEMLSFYFFFFNSLMLESVELRKGDVEKKMSPEPTSIKCEW